MPELEAQLRAYGLLLDRSDASTIADPVDASPRGTRRLLVVAVAAVTVLAIVVAAIAVATRSNDTRHPRIATPTPSSNPAAANGQGVVAVGDSVMLGAKSAMTSAIPGLVVDALVSRQPSQGAVALADDLAAGGSVGKVVVDLGTNGLTTADQLDAIMRAAAGRQVFFVTLHVPRTWEAPNNELLKAVPDRWSNAHVIDWNDYANAHGEWFTLDGFHLTSAGQNAYALLIAGEIGPPGSSPITTAPQPSGIDVVDVITKPTLAPQPLAVAGGDVWIASESLTATPSVRLERHDPATGKLLGTIDVPQEGLFSIAGDGDTLWVAGGGDGGVPETTVSRVDVRTNKVVFTKTLTGTACSCPIVAGSAGVWLLGNSSDFALHLSSDDGHVIANVPLPATVLLSAAMETRGRLLVGMTNSTVAIIDPSTNRIQQTVDVQGGQPDPGPVLAMSPASVPAVGSDPPIDGFIEIAGGIPHQTPFAFALFADRWQANEFLNFDFGPSTVVEIGGLMWGLGGDRVEVASTHAVVSNEFVYDAGQKTFARATSTLNPGGQGFRDAVTVDNMLWVVHDAGTGVSQPTVVVVKAPDPFPFK